MSERELQVLQRENDRLEYHNELLRDYVRLVDRVDQFGETHGDSPFYSDADTAELMALNDTKRRARSHLARRGAIEAGEGE